MYSQSNSNDFPYWEHGEEPDWSELTPDAEKDARIARQVRIMLASRKSISQVCGWLESNGFTSEEAEAYLAEIPEAKEARSINSRCIWIGVGFGVGFAFVATLIVRPWTLDWIDSATGWAVNPVAVLGYWFGGLSAFCFLCGFVGFVVGSIIDYLRERRIEQRVRQSSR